MGRKTKATAPDTNGRRFLLKFLGLVTLFFLAAAPVPVNRALVEPFTALLARAGGAVCHALGAGTRTIGTMNRTERIHVMFSRAGVNADTENSR